MVIEGNGFGDDAVVLAMITRIEVVATAVVSLNGSGLKPQSGPTQGSMCPDDDAMVRSFEQQRATKSSECCSDSNGNAIYKNRCTVDSLAAGRSRLSWRITAQMMFIRYYGCRLDVAAVVGADASSPSGTGANFTRPLN